MSYVRSYEISKAEKNGLLFFKGEGRSAQNIMCSLMSVVVEVNQKRNQENREEKNPDLDCLSTEQTSQLFKQNHHLLQTARNWQRIALLLTQLIVRSCCLHYGLWKIMIVLAYQQT